MEQPRRRLIVFDVDGVIIKGFWLSQIFARLGIIKSFSFGVLGILYELRAMEVTSFMRYSYKLLKGVPREWLIQMTDEATLIRGVRETLRILRGQHHILMLISSGIPTFAVARLAERVGAHFAVGIRVEVERGLLTGHIASHDCLGRSKVEAVKRLITSHKLHDYEVVAVANDRNNIQLLDFANLAVGFRPDRVTRRHVRSVVTMPDLRALLPVISWPQVRVYVPRRLSQEIVRQLLHATAVILPFLWLSDPSWHMPILFIIASLSALFMASELLRSHGIRLPLVAKLVQAAGREEEIGRYVISPLYFAAGVAGTLLIFTALLPLPLIAASSLIAFLIGDSFSTIGGLLYGRHHYPHPLNRKKTVEGSITGFSLAFLLLLRVVTPLSALLCTLMASLIEALPLPLDDNLAVPLLTATTLTLLQLLGLYTFI